MDCCQGSQGALGGCGFLGFPPAYPLRGLSIQTPLGSRTRLGPESARHSGVSGVSLAPWRGWLLGSGGHRSDPHPLHWKHIQLLWGQQAIGPCVCLHGAPVESKLCSNRCDVLPRWMIFVPWRYGALLSPLELFSQRWRAGRGARLGAPPVCLPAAVLPALGGRRNPPAAAGTWPGVGWGLAVLPPAHCTKPALVPQPQKRAQGPDLPGSSPPARGAPSPNRARKGRAACRGLRVGAGWGRRALPGLPGPPALRSAGPGTDCLVPSWWLSRVGVHGYLPPTEGSKRPLVMITFAVGTVGIAGVRVVQGVAMNARSLPLC